MFKEVIEVAKKLFVLIAFCFATCFAYLPAATAQTFEENLHSDLNVLELMLRSYQSRSSVSESRPTRKSCIANVKENFTGKKRKKKVKKCKNKFVKCRKRAKRGSGDSGGDSGDSGSGGSGGGDSGSGGGDSGNGGSSGNVNNGRSAWNTYCAACHSVSSKAGRSETSIRQAISNEPSMAPLQGLGSSTIADIAAYLATQ